MNDSRERFEATSFEGFKRYMDAPCHELHERDAGINDSHRLIFDEWGIPHEALLWIWQAAERDALERAAIAAWSTGMDLRDKENYLLQDPRETGSRCAKAIRALAGKE